MAIVERQNTRKNPISLIFEGFYPFIGTYYVPDTLFTGPVKTRNVPYSTLLKAIFRNHNNHDNPNFF